MEEEPPALRPPVFMLVISIVQIAVFIYYAVDMNVKMKARSPFPTYSPLVFDSARRYEAWRFFSYMFIHVGYVHIIWNVAVQLVYGLFLEMFLDHGPLRIGGIYIAGVVAGALATSIFPTKERYFFAGSSGGVWALKYAFLGHLIINSDVMKYPVALGTTYLVVCIMGMSYSIYRAYDLASSVDALKHVARIGGAIFGLLLGICILRNLKKSDWESQCMWAAVGVMVILIFIAVFVNIFADSYYPENDYRSMSEVKQAWMTQTHPERNIGTSSENICNTDARDYSR